jgi:hypothetical protein
MNNTPRLIVLNPAALALLAVLACSPALAGDDLHNKIPTAPTLYYACFSSVAKTIYGSGVSALPNPGPTMADHNQRNAAIQQAFQSHLQQRYGNGGVVDCATFESATAERWLADWKRNLVAGGNQWIDTHWTYRGGDAAAPSTAAYGAPPAAGGSAAAEMPGPYWACAAGGKSVQYDSAIFSGPNLHAQTMYWEYSSFLSNQYNTASMPNCESRKTRAEVETFLAQHAAGTIPGATSVAKQRVATGWIPESLGGPPRTPKPVAAPPPAPPQPQGPTSFYACRSFAAGTEYTSAGFEAQAQQTPAIAKAFDEYAIRMFDHHGAVECPRFATLAEAKEWINGRRKAAISGHFSIQTTHWMYGNESGQ